MRKIFFVLLCFIGPAFAQDVPKIGWERIHLKDLCAHSKTDVKKALGLPVMASDSCNSNYLYTTEMYGKEWVFYKSGYAFAVVDHRDYAGACWDQPPYKATILDKGISYYDVCK